MQTLIRSIFVCLFILSVSWACSDDLKELSLSKQRWQALDWKDYSYTYQQKCFCPVDYGRAMRVEVKNGQAISAYFVDTNEPVSEQVFKDIETINHLFEFLEKSLDRSPEKFIVSYHERYGFPEQIEIDMRLRRADDERKIQITDLAVK